MIPIYRTAFLLLVPGTRVLTIAHVIFRASIVGLSRVPGWQPSAHLRLAAATAAMDQEGISWTWGRG